jgi:hypothetical protein
MQADWSAESGADDAALEFPWASPDGHLRHWDVKRHPELIDQIEEVRAAPELRAFLLAINSPTSRLETAKCDAWFSPEVDTHEEIFGSCRFGSYVDLLFSPSAERFSFPVHEGLAIELADRLRQAPDIPASAEFVVRRCYYREQDTWREGFCLTCYVFGFGDDEASARKAWDSALGYAQRAIVNACG